MYAVGFLKNLKGDTGKSMVVSSTTLKASRMNA
jgi:hypothetical protein